MARPARRSGKNATRKSVDALYRTPTKNDLHSSVPCKTWFESLPGAQTDSMCARPSRETYSESVLGSQKLTSGKSVSTPTTRDKVVMT
jgi:hypothetical protein